MNLSLPSSDSKYHVTPAFDPNNWSHEDHLDNAMHPLIWKDIILSVFLFSSLILCILIGTGITYGIWVNELGIGGEIYTGAIKMQWADTSTCQGISTSGEGTSQWEINIDPVNPSVLTLVMQGLQPGDQINCNLDYQLQGTIPVYIRGAMLWPKSENLTNCYSSGIEEKTMDCDQLTIVWASGTGSQLNPGESFVSDFDLLIKSSVSEAELFKLGLAVCMAQWNEEATEDACFNTAQ